MLPDLNAHSIISIKLWKDKFLKLDYEKVRSPRVLPFLDSPFFADGPDTCEMGFHPLFSEIVIFRKFKIPPSPQQGSGERVEDRHEF